jgi:hypothetical protein
MKFWVLLNLVSGIKSVFTSIDGSNPQYWFGPKWEVKDKFDTYDEAVAYIAS